MVRWTYFQGKNRDPDVENEHMDTGGKGRVGQIERVALTYIHYHV